MNTAVKTGWLLGPAMGPIDQDVSQRIDVLRLILIFLIVLAHGARLLTGLVPGLESGTRFVISIFNDNITHSAIPLFFIISGYLFLRKFDLSVPAYLTMCRKKLLSIFVPYLLFNLIWVLWLYFVGSIEMFGSRSFLVQEGIWTKLFGLGTVPVNYPLWFLRDLLIVFIVSPVFLVFYKEAPLIGVVMLFFLWTVCSGAVSFSFYGNAFAFYVGGLLSRYDFNLKNSGFLDKYIYPSFVMLTTIMIFHEQIGMSPSSYHFIFKCNMLLGVLFFWCLSRYSFIKNNRFLHVGAAYSFFIYLTHEPTLSITQTSILSRFQPQGIVFQVLYFFITAIVTMIFLGFLGAALSRIVPGVYAVATGSRKRR
ncbi:MAG: acyltransferase family protein [Thermodesulfobacteriota bacterium]